MIKNRRDLQPSPSSATKSWRRIDIGVPLTIFVLCPITWGAAVILAPFSLWVSIEAVRALPERTEIRVRLGLVISVLLMLGFASLAIAVLFDEARQSR